MNEDLSKPISVSISPLFKQLLDKHNFSPTEVFRVGMALMLAEQGDIKYSNAFNIERLEKAKKQLREIKNTEELAGITLENEICLAIHKNFKSIKKIVKDI